MRKKPNWNAVSLFIFILLIVAIVAVATAGYSQPFEWHNVLFNDGKDTNLGGYVKFIGAAIGGLIVFWGLLINNERVRQMSEQVKNQNKQNEIAERGQIGTRFKDAALLLAEDNISANLSGVEALYQIAKEEYINQTKNGYIETIYRIFYSYLHENIGPHKEDKRSTQTVGRNLAPVIQSIIDKLLKNDGEKIFNISNINLKRFDLRNIDLESVYLQGANLQEAYLQSVNLQKSNLQEANLVRAKLISAKLQHADFSGATLKSALLQRAKMQHANFTNASLDDVRFKRATMKNINMEGASVIGGHLQDLMIESANLNNANFVRAHFNESHFNEMRFSKVNFHSANFAYSRFHQTSFNDVVFTGANLWGTRFVRCDFRKVYLRDVKNNFTCFSESVFSYEDVVNVPMYVYIDEEWKTDKFITLHPLETQYTRDQLENHFYYAHPDLSHSFLVHKCFQNIILIIDSKEYYLSV